MANQFVIAPDKAKNPIDLIKSSSTGLIDPRIIMPTAARLVVRLLFKGLFIVFYIKRQSKFN
jgi:hypothetical protein